MSGTPSDFVRLIEPVACELLGCGPNKALSTKKELRFGSRGSFAVDLEKGTWFDHEAGDKGGGVLDLLKARKGLEKSDALQWLRDRKHLPPETFNGMRIVQTYDYADAAGNLVFQVVRLDPKDFRQRRPDPAQPSKWIWKTSGIQLPLYHLPEVLDAVKSGRTIFVAEGEKAVDALRKLGVVATCSPGGAGKWKAHQSPSLTGADVVLLPDNDQPGLDHVAKVRKALTGTADSVRVLALPGLPEKGDAFDWIEAGGTLQQLEALLGELQYGEASRDEPSTEPPPGLGPNTAAATGADEEEIKAGIQRVIAEFNSRYMLVNEDGKAVILQPGFDPVLKRRKYDHLATRDLQTLYMNQLVKIGHTEKGEAVWKTAADVWLRHRDRRQFIHGVEFNPGAAAKPGVLNLWEGFAVKPRRGDWSLMRDHMRDVMCAADPIRFDYLVRWIALMLQRPAQMGEVAVVLKGVEGCGKGTLARAIMHIMGGHGLAISNAKHLVGNFNAHLASTVFLFADEAFFAGDRAHVAVLKALITERQLAIEAKFANMRNQPNFLHLMMASNEEWVVPASLEARRFFVLDVLPNRVRDYEYFNAIWRQMEASGYEGMLYDLLHMDLTGFNVRNVPTTEGLQQQRKLSLPVTEAWWMDCLQRGYVFRSQLGLEDIFGVWMPRVSIDLLYDSYLDFAKSRGERRPITREELGRFFQGKLRAKQERGRNIVTGEALRDVDNAFGGSSRKAQAVRSERPRCYVLGDLDAARAEFTKLTTLRVDWDGTDGEAGSEYASLAIAEAAPDPRHDPACATAENGEGPDWVPYAD